MATSNLHRYTEQEASNRLGGGGYDYVTNATVNSHVYVAIQALSVDCVITATSVDTDIWDTLSSVTVLAGGWSVNSPGTAGSSADVTNSIHLALATMTSTLGIYSAVEIYFNFATSETNVTAANDMVIPKNTMIYLTVPRGLGNTVYFNYNSTSTTTGAVKTVEI